MDARCKVNGDKIFSPPGRLLKGSRTIAPEENCPSDKCPPENRYSPP